jgi:AcrR family transcriptional regulator
VRVSSAERKDQLIRATVELMRTDGVQNLSLRAIAEQAGASLATVHYCFDGKDDLLVNAVEYWLRRMVDVPELDETAISSGVEEVASRIAEAFWTSLEENPNDVLAQIELVTWAVRESPKKRLARRIYQRYEATLGEIFDDALTTSGQTSTWEARDLARAFIFIVDGASLQYMADPSSPRHRALFERMLTVLLNDVVADEAGRPRTAASAAGR